MGFSRQEYWHGVPFPSPGDLPNPGIEPRSPELQTDALPSEPQLGNSLAGVGLGGAVCKVGGQSPREGRRQGMGHLQGDWSEK